MEIILFASLLLGVHTYIGLKTIRNDRKTITINEEYRNTPDEFSKNVLELLKKDTIKRLNKL